MENRCCVSVIIPIYNVEEYLEECLDSIAAQSLDAMEVLLVDDGSTDNSSIIAQRYAGQFDHFKYFRKENGGLGSARNFGTDHAIGEYVAYCDSDDIIPPFAYEHMYALAKKCDCDIVSGDVDRFIGNKRYESSLHRIAFAKASERENIYQNPRLIFDTIAPNKLFRLEYLKTTGIRFPEDMLYEDIPTVIPLVCLTKEYAHLDEVVYSWRERDNHFEEDETNESDEWKAFPDLLHALQIVDDFFKDNIFDGNLRAEKDFRWLSSDLCAFINALPNASKDYQTLFMNRAIPYVKSIGTETLARLEANDRIKYYYLLNRDIEGLLRYLEFAKSSAAYKALPLSRKNGRYYGKFPFNLPSEYTDLTNEITENGCTVSVRKAALDKTVGLQLEGRIFYARLSASKNAYIDIDAFLVSSEDNSIIVELPAAIVIDPNCKGEWLRNLKRHYFRYVKRELVRFGTEIDYAILNSLNPGKYHIEIAYRCNDLQSRRIFVAHPIQGNSPRPFALFADNRRYAIDYDINGGLVITAETIERPIVDDVETNSNQIILKNGSAIVASHSIGNQSIDDLKNLTTIINEKEYLYKKNCEEILSFENLTIRIQATKQGYLQLEGYGPSATSIDSSFENATITFTIDKLPERINPSEVKPIIVGQNHGTRIACDDYRCTENGAIICRIDVSKNDLSAQLRADTYRLFLQLDEQSKSNQRLIHVLSTRRDPTKPRRIAGQKFEYSLTNDGQEGFCVSVAWNPYENTPHRRNVMQNRVYKPLYKVARALLPIDKNMVLFESYWGTQIGCSPASFSRFLTRNHPEMHCVWLVTDERIPTRNGVKRVRKGTLSHYLAAARAHYFVSNVHFDSWLQKRRGQVLIQTTHGTPLKKVGLAAPSEFKTKQAYNNFARECKNWDYLIASGPGAESILKDNYKYAGQFLRTGLPRNDSLFVDNNIDTIANLRQQYDVPREKKLILYAPTWRKRDQFDLKLDLTKIANEIGDEYVIGLRPHHLSIAGLNIEKLDPRVINLAAGPSAEECYLMSDLIITDYSSLMFDAALLNKPMLFFVYDLDEYRDKLRGFNIDFESEAPGPLLKTNAEIIAAIKSIDTVCEEYAVNYEHFKKKYCGYECGNACEQIYQLILLHSERTIEKPSA